ncbi:hypothetical protein HK098_004296 [Nowakowskiella sp. JEL0407]|nr:hypothetical protein HK098_004296 [Nowakowskiella sp. JEL0407]
MSPIQQNTVILIRHAEKHEWDGGLKPSKMQISSYVDNKLLSVKGRERAHALVGYFQFRDEILQIFEKFPMCDIVCQDVDTGEDAWGKSRRPIETMEPLALALNKQLVLYTKKQAPELITRILNSDEWNGKTIIVCWAHQELGDLAKRLGVPENEVPEWGKRYDITWVVSTFNDGTAKLQQFPQRLLYGDKD